MNALPAIDIAAYWKQIYNHLRRRCNCPHHEAEDLTQDLFAHLLGKGLLKEIGERFGSEDEQRNYLFAAARNLFNSAKRRETTAKRGGGAIHLTIGNEKVDDQINPSSNTNTPSEEIEQRELRAHWQRELSTLAKDATRQGKLALFTRVRGALAPGERSVDSREVASDLGIAPGTLRVQMHRWRERLFENMRVRLAEPVAA